MNLLKRIAHSHGDPQRTITALRLINAHLVQELSRPSTHLDDSLEVATPVLDEQKRAAESCSSNTNHDRQEQFMGLKRILVVDDEPCLRTILERCLGTLGENYQVVTAKDGSAAMDRLREQAFDLIVTDYNMPGMTGLELIQAVRQISPATRVILMTGNRNPKLHREIEQFELAGYLDKPFSPVQLQKIVRQNLEYTNGSS